MNFGPGDTVAGLAPPQDNPAAVTYRSNQNPRKLFNSTGPGPRPTADATDGQGKQNQQQDSLATAGTSQFSKDSGNAPSVGPDGEPITAEDHEEGDSLIAAPPPSLLIGYITSSWARNKRARDLMETRLLDCLWARRAEYSPMEVSDFWSVDAGAGALVYQPLAATKMRQGEAALRDLLLPDGADHPWGLDPVDDPKLPQELEDQISQIALSKAKDAMTLLAQAQQGKVLSPTEFLDLQVEIREQVWNDKRAAHVKQAKMRATRMEQYVATDLELGGYYTALAEFVQHFCTFPSAVLKGPYLSMARVRTWEGNRLIVKKQPQLTWSAVHPMDAYPAPGAKSCQDGDFFEHIRLTRSDLFEMIGLDGYDTAAIRRILDTHASGGLRAWLWSDMERRRAEGQTNTTWLPEYQIDALHYWGSVQGRDLIEHGVQDIADPLGYYEVDAVLIGNELIRCAVNEDKMGERPYWVASYDTVPGAFWGNSIYDLIRSCQDIVNACARSLNANMGLASGPIQFIDMSQMAPGQDPKNIRPLQQIQIDTSTASTPRKAVEFFQAESNSADLLGVLKEFSVLADLYSGIPRYQEGDAKATGAAATLGGLSMLMSQASKGLRRAVANADSCIDNTIRKTYDYEMENNPDEEAKGPCNVVARGSVALLIKEHLQATRMQFLGQVLGSEKLISLVGDERIANLLRHVTTTLDMPVEEIVPTDLEMKQRAATPPPPPPGPTPDAQLDAQVQDQKIQSHERIAGAKVAAAMVKDHRGHMADLMAKQQQPQAATPSAGGMAPPTGTVH